MNGAAEKAERERRVFQTFITTGKLPIAPETVESRPPPEPDILCLHAEEGHIAFELVEICEEMLARKLSAIDKEEFGFVRSQDPSRLVLRKKLRKNYRTGHPVELLCYVDRSLSADSQILATIRPMIDMNNGQFRRIWLLGDECHLVWPSRGPTRPPAPAV
jgi:hypothetical protein